MSRTTKKIAVFSSFIFSTALVTSCSLTKPFCSNFDKTQQMYTYYTENVVKSTKNDDGIYEIEFDDNNHTSFSDTFVNSVKESNLFLPSVEFTNFIDDKVEAYIQVDSNFNESVLNLASEHENAILVDKVKRSLALFGGFEEDPNEQVLWLNFNGWVDEFATLHKDNLTLVPSTGYINYFQTQINNGVSQMQACLTPTDGIFNMGNTYIEGKTWGQAFTEYGPLEGLLVYPTGIMLHYFATWMGNTGIGQVFAILFVTIIVRLIIVVFSIFSTKSQNRMTELQPEIAALQQKYPNSDNDKEQKAALSRETMNLYKKNGVHPFLSILILIIQFPIFISVWSAMQGSAILTDGSVLGLSLTTTISQGITSLSSATPLAVILFIILCISQFISTRLPAWFQTWQTEKFVRVTVQTDSGQKSRKMMNYVSYFMIVFICFMGFTLPSAMAMYWFFGSLISIAQTIITQYAMKRRRRRGGKGGDGSTLASQRRSKNHTTKTKTKSIRSSR